MIVIRTILLTQTKVKKIRSSKTSVMAIGFTKVLKTVVATVCLLLLIVTFQTKFSHSRTAPPTTSLILRSDSRSEQPKNESPILTSVIYILHSVHYNSIMTMQIKKSYILLKLRSYYRLPTNSSCPIICCWLEF
jgi:hypothetical protein